MTLVIIDMQDEFLRNLSNNKKSFLIKNVSAQIEKSYSVAEPTVFIEYANYGETIDCLTPYHRNEVNYFLVKENDDGGQDLFNFMLSHKLNFSKVKFCGVNTDCCVYQTVTTFVDCLANSYPKTKIQVIENACNSSWDHEDGISELKKFNSFYSDLKIKII